MKSRSSQTDMRVDPKPDVSPFEIAKQALGHVGRFQTPPTPSVYEVWYRYVEGVDDIIANLSHAVEDVNSVTVDMLDQLHKQYCVPSETSNQMMAEELIGEMSSLQAVVDDQIQAGQTFGDSINEACDSLNQDNPSLEIVAACAKTMLVSNAAMQQQIKQLNQQLQASQEKVQALQHELIDSQRATMTDPLTGLGNRRHFEIGVRKSLVANDRDQRNTFLFVIDVDHFKTINDTYGHECGDKVIKYVASQISRHCTQGSISRIGGDEFAIIVDVADHQEASEIATELRKFFASTPLKLNASGDDLGTIKLSIGAACLREDDDEKSWFVRADKLLYQAKDGGRNNAVVEHFR
ncbi:GGDEF domain-containing protein [Neorhodopirellula pilleata]|nr:GGDEF domain-containing protein [Neorhodopirellula pilleata]